MSNVSMKAMLEAGVHFGHQTSRWNPKMGRFIFGERNGVHILDLQKTAKELKKACAFIKEETKKGAKFLFVGTKKQAQEAIQAEAARCGAYCIHEKWLGGTLTNFQTVKKSVERLNELEKWEASGVFKAISKKEASRLTKEMQRLQKLLGGIRDMKVLPDVVFVIDPVDTAGAVRESHTLGIPVVAVCDTNADPDMIDVPVPGNDDAARSIKLFCGAIADSILEARAEMEAVNKPAEAAEEGKPVENPVMAQAFESAMLAGEKAAQEAEAKAAEAPKAQEEEKAEEVKAEEPAEKKVKKAAAKKPAAKKTTAKTKKAAKAETEEVKAEEAPAEEAK
ncbi:30S ribosomal protein S2 [Candidatus Avelusimicrobium faecicola]|uniref:30S ribosomal protein S2 n=1 Tax=Candidatus Avelusimicrobium faecicola TaxID=3416205 RepID=UPI003CA8601D|nr:30S ribosomal protein S2 [Spirochaetota bacterium]